MKISKKILVLFFVAISLGLFASFLPVKTSSTPSVKAETTVAKIYNKITSGWNTYTTLESAISASASGGIIVLSADYTINAEIVLSKNITIVSDNNSKLTKSFYGTMFTVPQGYTLTFGSITDTYYGLTLTNIYLDGQSSYDFSGPFVNNKGQLYLNKQCVVQNAYMSSYDSSAILNKSGVLTANGAKFINNNGNNETEGVIKSTYVSGSTEPNNSFIDCYFEKNNGNTIYAEDNCTFTLTDCTFKNNNQLVFRRGPANVTITGCTFNNNIITIDEIFSEGLIDYECQNGGYLKLNGCNFTYNQADKGIYSYFNCVHFAYGEQLLVTECEFAYNYGNTINVVGASASSNSNVEITNSLIYSNETNSILSLTNATANIEDCSIKNNTPESTATSSSNGSININTSIVTIKNTELNNNISTLPSSGSQIYVEENSVLNLEECTIKNGEYATDVKAVYLTKNSGLNLKTSNEIGGTIYLESDTTNSLNPSISIADDYQYSSSSYTLDFSNPELYNEQDEVYAVQFSDSVNWGAFTVSTDGYYLIRGKSSNILNNMYAAKAVAKIYTSTGWAYYDTLSSAVAFAQAGDTIVVFEDCVVEGTIDVDKNLTIVSDNNSKITKSHTYEIFNVVDCTLTIGNQNTTYQGLTLTDIYIDGNKDEVSSVEPLIKCEGNLNLYSGCYIQNNNNTYSQIITPENPSNAAGVAIYGAQSILNIFGAKIVGNTSAKRGAGIWAYGIANILIDSAHFAYNTATEGAALYCKNSQSLILNNCKFNNNNVTNNSGVLYVTSENKYIANISNTEFVSNQGFATCYLVFIKANITNCSVTNSSRLGMYFDGAEGTVSNCYFAGNEEYAIRKSGGNISVIGSVIEENSAGINAQGSMTINYCTITNNNGVGVTGSASASLTILNSEISNNANGGISFDTTGSLSVDNCKILGNSADTGAGIYINNGVTSIIKNTIISNNTATQNGSALYVGNSNNKLTLNSCSIYDNICESANGYGIYMGYGVNLTLENSNIISEVINVNYYLAYGPKPIIIAQNYDFADNTYKILATDATIYTEANSIQIIQFENAEELNLNKFVCLNDGYAFTKGTSTSNLNNLYLTTNVVAKIYDDSTSSWNYFSSLETAIQSAPNNSTIVFCGDDDYILSSTIQIDKNLTIVSDAEATITKSHTGALFNVASGYTLTIGNQNETYQGLTLTPITLSGDGDNITSTEPLLINFGTLNLLSGCYVQDNKNNGSYNGGGIYNQGILNIDGATIYYNIASALGGGIYNVGELTINNATIESNGSQNGGAGIFNVGSLTLNSTQISNNGIDYDGSHYGTGVAIYSVNGSLNIYNCTIKGNFSDTGFCIDATSNTVISGTTITDNDTLTTIRFETDGIKTLTITDCEIKNNYGYAVDCYSSTQSLAQSPVVIIKNSIITDNYDLGLIFNSYINALVENSEISRNDCTQVETYSDTILTLKETTLNLFEGETDVIVIAGTLKLINKNKINGDIFVAEATAKIVIESEYYYNDTIGLYFAEPELYLTTSIVEFANLDEVNINAFTCSNVGYRLVQGTTEDTNNKLYLSNKFTFTYNHNSPELTNNVVEYAYGATITPIANPTRNHYTFAGWYTEAECETEYTFTTMPANDVTVYAKWEKATYTITATANAGGTITPNGEATYNYLDTQTYTIVANTGYAVKAIKVDGQALTENQITVALINGYTFDNISANHTIEVEFVINTYTITVIQAENGTISAAEASYNYGDNATFTITADDGYIVEYLVIDDQKYTDTLGTYTFENISKNHTISAKFKAGTSTNYTVKHWQESLTTDEVTEFNGKYYTLISTETLVGETNAYTNATANTYEGFTAQQITQQLVSSASDTIVNVLYDRNIYEVILTKDEGFDSVTGAGIYKYGENVNINAVISAGYVWHSWTSNNEAVESSTNIEYSFTMPTTSICLQAKSTKQQVNVEIITTGNGTVTPNTNQTLDLGSNLTLIFTPSEGYKVKDVKVDGASQGEISVYIFENLTANHTVSVEFELKRYTITVSVEGKGTLTCEQTLEGVLHGDNRLFTLENNDGWKVYNVYINGESVTLENNELFITNIQENIQIQVILIEEVSNTPVIVLLIIGITAATVAAGALIVKLVRDKKTRTEIAQKDEKIMNMLKENSKRQEQLNELKTNKKSQNETNTKTIETSTQAMPKVPPKNSNVTKGDKKSENKK